MTSLDDIVTQLERQRDAIDNALEALDSLPDAARQTVIAQKLAKLLVDQDAAAQQGAADDGAGNVWTVHHIRY